MLWLKTTQMLNRLSIRCEHIKRNAMLQFRIFGKFMRNRCQKLPRQILNVGVAAFPNLGAARLGLGGRKAEANTLRDSIQIRIFLRTTCLYGTHNAILLAL